MAPRLRQAPPHDRQSQERAARKTRKRIAELEKDITQKENSIGALEDRMAAPGFYDDRAQADQAGHEHKSLKTELDALLREWEELQVAVT
jgi:chromosome segregation ATPase